MQKTKQIIYKQHFFLIGLIFFCLILIPNVSALTSTEVYNAWSYYHKPTMSMYQGNSYTDTLMTPPTVAEGSAACIRDGGTGIGNPGNLAIVSFISPVSGTDTFSVTPVYGGILNKVYWQYVPCNGAPYYTVNKWWIGYNSATPTYYTPANITVTVKNKQGMRIARADVEITGKNSNGIISQSGKTDLNGVFTPTIYLSFQQGIPANITASKVGYNTTVQSLSVTSNASINTEITIGDAIWSGEGQDAVVYLDVKDITDNTAISGANIGIKNTTTTINPWSYSLYPTSTIMFDTDGNGHKLSIGQKIQFAGYKTGVYSAGHTEEYTILQPITKMELSLTKSDQANITTNISEGYYYPVSVVDAVTGNNIANSDLSVSLWTGQESNWFNSTSGSGKWTITGYGTGGTIPIETGDVINIYTSADGYESNGWGLIASQENNGITQMRPLMPSGITPISGEFNAQIQVVDNDNQKPLGGVVLILEGLGNTVTQVTNNGGSSVFKNLTVGTTYNIQATAYGYTTTSQTFSGISESTKYVDFFLSKSSMNPVYTVPITEVPTYTPIITYPVVTPSSWNDTGAQSCIDVPKNATFIQFMKIKLACNGFDTGMAQSLAIAGIIIMLFVGIGAQYGKANGAVIGAIIGFVLAFAAGLIPFSVLALIIALLVLVAIISITRK